MSGETDSSFVWFSKHPVISTVLWLIGNPENENENEQHDSTGKLTWKDHDGASLADFVSDVQPKRSPNNASLHRTPNTSNNNNHGSALKNSRKKEVLGHQRTDNNNSHASPDNNMNGSNPEQQKSPQWDQFITITPNTPMFPTSTPK